MADKIGVSDRNGDATLTLSFSEEDIGKTYFYQLTEVDSGRAYVVYSTQEYAIAVTISLDTRTNTLVADLEMNGEKVSELMAEFENTFDYTPDPSIPENPDTGDTSNLSVWIALMIISSGAALTLLLFRKRKMKMHNKQ